MRALEGEHPRGDTGQLALLGLFLAVWVADSFVFRATTLLGSRVPLALRLVILATLLGTSAILVRSGHRAVDLRHGDGGLVTDGAFRLVRHPLYLGSVLFYLGLAVSTASVAALALTAGIFAFYDRIASFEERWLEDRHGEAYRAYRQRVGKWFPRP